MERLGGLFGADWETKAGGGGTGGQFMFASIADLDSVIAQWKDQLAAIIEDGRKIDQIAGFISPPAQDKMSVGQADATTQSMVALREHNRAMRDYAVGYIQKLEASRASMVNSEQSNKSTMDNVY